MCAKFHENRKKIVEGVSNLKKFDNTDIHLSRHASVTYNISCAGCKRQRS